MSKKGRLNNVTEEKELPSQQAEGMRQNECEVEVVEIMQELSRMTKRSALTILGLVEHSCAFTRLRNTRGQFGRGSTLR